MQKIKSKGIVIVEYEDTHGLILGHKGKKCNFAITNIDLKHFTMKITKEVSIEDLVEGVPGSVEYLMKAGIRCIVCGEPIWGTLEEAAQEKGFDAVAIEGFVSDLNALFLNPSEMPIPKAVIQVKKM
jgi:PP-loop superfamily ATP-utilizing enzyme